MNEILNSISTIISENIYIAPILVFIAGILTSFTPCSLSTLPLILTYLNNGKVANIKESFKLSLVFSIGMALTFTIFGTLAALIGKVSQFIGSWWYIFLGILMIMMVLQILEIFTFIKPTYLTIKNKRKGYIGAFLTGILGGIFSSPCSTPILIVVLSIISTNSNILNGIILLLIYSIGNTALVILTGTFIGFNNSLLKNKKIGKISIVLKYITAFLVFLIALYMFYLGF